MLPVPFDQYLAEPLQYQAGNPPYLPHIVIMPQADHLVPYAASAVANEAGAQAGRSIARLFCFNILANNNWQNQAYDEVVKLVCDYSVLQQHMNVINNAGSVIGDSANKILTLYTSVLVVTYPELARMLDPAAVNAAASNHRTFIDITNDITYMYSNTQPYQAPPPPQTRFQQPAMSRNVAPSALPAGALNLGTAHNQNRPGPSGPVQGERMSTKPKPVSSPVVQPAEPVKKKETGVQDTRLLKILREGLENMDRDVHSIPYFGKKVPADIPRLKSRFEEIAQQQMDLAKDPKSIEVFYTETMAAETSVDDLITNKMIEWMPTDQTGVNIHRANGFVIMPVISSLPIEGYFLRLSHCTTFAETAETIQQIIDSASSEATKRQVYQFAAQLDRILTELTNEFFVRLDILTNDKPRITSFIEDAPEIPKYLNEKFNGAYNAAYVRFQKSVMKHLFKHLMSAGDPIAQLLDGITETQFVEGVVQQYSLTYISATPQELGYKTDKHLRYIRNSETPVFRKLIDSVLTLEELCDDPVHHLLILADGSRYRLYRMVSQFAEIGIQKV